MQIIDPKVEPIGLIQLPPIPSHTVSASLLYKLAPNKNDEKLELCFGSQDSIVDAAAVGGKNVNCLLPFSDVYPEREKTICCILKI